MGKLYIIPTPIGNLEDITLRALNILKKVDLIYAEDTRKTGILLKKYNISKRLSSYHQYNEHQLVGRIIKRLNDNENIAVLSDAGTPGISDAGFLLVRECINNNIEVECLPGPTAFLPALIVSGLPCDKFLFEGFLPHKKGRKSRLEELAKFENTIVFYESPHRLLKTLKQIAEYFGAERKIAVSRELTKVYEETIRGDIKKAIEHFTKHPPKGEFVITLAGCKN